MTGQQLKKLRKKLGISLSQAAKQCEVSVSTWCRWENLKTVPLRAEKLFKLVNLKKAIEDADEKVKGFIASHPLRESDNDKWAANILAGVNRIAKGVTIK